MARGPLQNADNTHVGRATISVNATHSGNGGKLVVWSNGLTDFSGIVSAMGGLAGGDGGFVETSGHNLSVAPTASIDTRAPKGNTGTWLLDPTVITISNTGGNTSIPPSGTINVADPNTSTSDIIAPSTITTALNTTDVTLEASSSITVASDGALNYTSGHTLSLLSEGTIAVNANIQNAGTGAINLIAGWRGGTTDFSNLTLDSTSFGQGEGSSVTIGNGGSAAVGSAGGVTTVAGADVYLDAAASGSVGQIGYRGTGGGGGDINVLAKFDLELTADGGGGAAAQIGNGDFQGNVFADFTGDISIAVGGDTGLYAQSGPNFVSIGNSHTTGHTATGNLVWLTGSIDANDAPDGLTAVDPDEILQRTLNLDSGNVTLGVTNDDLEIDTPIDYTSSGALTLLSTGSISIDASIQNHGTGDVALVAGWDGETLGTGAQIFAACDSETCAYGAESGNITIAGGDGVDVAVGSAGGTTYALASNLDIEASGANYAQIGFHGNGGGDIVVRTAGLFGVTLNTSNSDLESGTSYAMIGNGSRIVGDVTGDVTGDIDIRMLGNGALSLTSNEGVSEDTDLGAAIPWIGNVTSGPGAASGNVILVAANNDGGGGNYNFELNIAADLQNGDFLFGSTDTDKPAEFVGDFIYDSPHTFSIVSMGDVEIESNIQNNGTGAINVIAGWDGTTVNPAQLTVNGAFGNNDAEVIVSGFNDRSGGPYNASVGSAGRPGHGRRGRRVRRSSERR